MANNYFREKGRDVFVIWNPSPEGDNKHRIARLKEGGFEVSCCHKSYDKETIRAQIQFLIRQEEKEKKEK